MGSSRFFAALALLLLASGAGCVTPAAVLRNVEDKNNSVSKSADNEVSKPRISPSGPLHLHPAMQASLVCSISNIGDEIPGMHWEKYGSGLSGEENIEVQRLDNNTISLLIKYVTARDSGVYSCIVTYGGARISQTVEIHVYEEWVFVNQEVQVMPPLKHFSLNLSCEVEKDPKSIYTTWLRDGANVEYRNKQLKSEKYKLYKRGAILEIKDYNPDTDYGSYYCRILEIETGATTERRVAIGSDKYRKCMRECTLNCSHASYFWKKRLNNYKLSMDYVNFDRRSCSISIPIRNSSSIPRESFSQQTVGNMENPTTPEIDPDVPGISSDILRELRNLRLGDRLSQRRFSDCDVANLAETNRSDKEQRSEQNSRHCSFLRFNSTSESSSTPINTISSSSLTDTTSENVAGSFRDSPTDEDSLSSMFQQVKTVSIGLSLLVENVLFAEAGNRVWVAGWTHRIDFTGYKNTFSFCDELIKVGNMDVKGINDLPALFYESQKESSDPIVLVLRIAPYAKFVCLRKPIAENKSIGIHFYKLKNRCEMGYYG
ncbi:unnamed protein product [Caenorhabditis auriculariae]|uniref:Ig-like domain-containing protein n=1 Tax=Caenorhabditis auriculariae TaxID=2777116 RepID=A0A8S1GRQ9_9PELO|nr:unnamed protein product [Caenorhabditis auriculariae]